MLRSADAPAVVAVSDAPRQISVFIEVSHIKNVIQALPLTMTVLGRQKSVTLSECHSI